MYYIFLILFVEVTFSLLKRNVRLTVIMVYWYTGKLSFCLNYLV